MAVDESEWTQTCEYCKWWKPQWEVMECKREGGKKGDVAGYESCDKWEKREKYSFEK